MREIKYRARDNDGTWIYSKPMPDMGFWKWVQYDSTTIFNENTGLKDKNGVEIYEGDIVEFPQVEMIDPDGGYESSNWRHFKVRAEVTFDNGRFKRKDKFGDFLSSKDDEVIGNIYEHSHLLKGKDAQ